MKTKIKQIVEQYKQLFPSEYKEVVILVAEKKLQNALNDNKFGKIEGEILERQLMEYPETLYNMIMMKLEDEEKIWFNSKKGALWFAKHYKEFNTVKL